MAEQKYSPLRKIRQGMLMLLWLSLCAVSSGAAEYVRFDTGSVAVVRGATVAARRGEDLRAAVARSMHTLAFLASSAQSRNLHGRQLVRLSVEAGGEVSAVRTLESSVTDTALEAGMRRALMRWRFAPVDASAGPTTFSFTLLLGSAPPTVLPASVAAAPPRVTAPASRPPVAASPAGDAWARYVRSKRRTAGGMLISIGAGVLILGAGSFALGAASEGAWFPASDRVLKGAGIGCGGLSAALIVSGIVVLSRASGATPRVSFASHP